MAFKRIGNETREWQLGSSDNDRYDGRVGKLGLSSSLPAIR